MDIEMEIICEICTNPKKNALGCDGNCRYDEKLLKKLIEEYKEGEE